MEYAFDTHAAVKDLKMIGMSEEQAVVFVKLLLDSRRDLVTKQYLDLRLSRMTISIGAMQIALGGFLAAIKFFA